MIFSFHFINKKIYFDSNVVSNQKIYKLTVYLNKLDFSSIKIIYKFIAEYFKVISFVPSKGFKETVNISS